MESFDSLDPGQDSDNNPMTLASDFLESFSSDRASGCGSDYGFEPIEPEPIVLANTPGLVYRFVGTTSDGASSELVLQYATIAGDELVLIVAAAYDEGGCPGRDELSSFDTESLSVLRPYLESVLHESSLPDLDVLSREGGGLAVSSKSAAAGLLEVPATVITSPEKRRRLSCQSIPRFDSAS